MVNSFFQKQFNWICETFKHDTSKMLIVTGTAGWALSSLAQMCGILANPKISTEKKSFLLPQELMDAVVNVGAFFGITMFAKKCIAKMASTGKIAPQSVRNFLNAHPEYKDKIGKFDFNLDKILSKDSKNSELLDIYDSHKNFVTTMGTVGASILSCNIVTPIIRNATASRVQKRYIDMKNNPAAYQYPAPERLKV